jgi:hypothetical protein
MLVTEDLLRLLGAHCPRDVSRVGQTNVRMIVEDFVALGPDARQFEKPDAGHHFDLSDAIALIIGALQLFVAVGDIVVRERRRREEISTEELTKIVQPQLDKLDLSRIPDEEKLIVDVIELAQRHGS